MSASTKRAPTVPAPDLHELVPGGRLRLRDWRDGSLVDGTFIAFIARAPMRIGPNVTVRVGQRFGRLGASVGPRVDVVAYRDGFCGDRVFASRDVVELLPSGTDIKRARRIERMLRGLATECDGCRAFIEDPSRTAGRHKEPDRCPGLTFVPELAGLLMEIRDGKPDRRSRS